MRSVTMRTSLDQLADEPDRAAALALELTLALLARVSVVQSALTARAVALALMPAAPTASDALLDINTAAAKLGVSTSYLYRNARTLPFTVRVGRSIRFSANGIERHIRERQGV
jgi:predicted DNA-binding transcriptional regulator AlpA